MTAVRGLAGHVLDRMTSQWWTTSDIANAATVSLSQAGTCLARLVRLGLVEKGDRHASGLRLWRRVDRPAAFKVGDRVEWASTPFPPNVCSRGTVIEVDDTTLNARDDNGGIRIWPTTMVRRIDEHAPAAPITPRAWTPQRRPDVDPMFLTPFQQRGWAP